ncbi:hypothetical protein AOLI_G00269870 [Acnodon oligacanthus]
MRKQREAATRAKESAWTPREVGSSLALAAVCGFVLCALAYTPSPPLRAPPALMSRAALIAHFTLSPPIAERRGRGFHSSNQNRGEGEGGGGGGGRGGLLESYHSSPHTLAVTQRRPLRAAQGRRRLSSPRQKVKPLCCQTAGGSARRGTSRGRRV